MCFKATESDDSVSLNLLKSVGLPRVGFVFNPIFINFVVVKVLRNLREEETERLCGLLDQEAIYQLDRSIMREFLSKGEVCQYNRREILGAAGSVDTHIYILIDGVVRHWYWSGDNEMTAGFALSGTLFMYYQSYYYGHETHSYYEACCKSRILRFQKPDFDEMIRRSHEFAQWSLSMAQCQLYYYEMKKAVINGNVREQYEAIEKNRPEILQKVPLRTIASYLGVSPQYLSKIRNKKTE